MPPPQSPIVLVVDTDAGIASQLRSVVHGIGHHAIAHTSFQAARTEMRLRELAALIANVRLGPYNGIHLAYTAKHAHPEVRVMIYAIEQDALLARETQRAGAFYERHVHVPFVIERFLGAELPPGDRRSVTVIDRRASFRGGRRCTDQSRLQPVLGI